MLVDALIFCRHDVNSRWNLLVDSSPALVAVPKSLSAATAIMARPIAPVSAPVRPDLRRCVKPADAIRQAGLAGSSTRNDRAVTVHVKI